MFEAVANIFEASNAFFNWPLQQKKSQALSSNLEGYWEFGVEFSEMKQDRIYANLFRPGCEMKITAMSKLIWKATRYIMH